MQRRRLLQLGLGSAAVLALAGGVAALWAPGLQGPRLTAGGRRAMGAVARAVLEGSLPHTDEALNQHLDHLESLFAAFPPAIQAELQQLMGLLVNAPGRLGVLGQWRPLEALDLATLQQQLEGLRRSRLGLRQQVYFALRDLHCAAFFAQPQSWAALGYPGPRTVG
ncbi:hypothetical protein [Inhella gelatinilytica]|uniref:Twin-arginine translocation pathway signal protein n=1 Tax=Inhella gelatinilytica TaxID=2795030 RepID=A0A931IWS4_9BURK|nr:hypothetical protein [Inhella gelatinilytica]MBH9552479.1 hypothetical protein [Inhella gelatinilytica]